MKRYKRHFEKYSTKDFENNLDHLVEIATGEILFTWGDSGWKVYEAVINVKAELNNIKEILQKEKNNFYKEVKDLNDFKIFFEKLFRNRKISFLYHSGLKVYTDHGGYNSDNDIIFLYFGSSVLDITKLKDDELFNKLVNALLKHLGHELVHRGQAIRIKNEKIRNFIFDKAKKALTNKKDRSGKEISDEKAYINYLSNPQELMSHAWQIVNNFRLCGFNDEQIAKLLKTESDVAIKSGGIFFHDYLFLVESPKIKKNLYKYMYQYLDNK